MESRQCCGCRNGAGSPSQSCVGGLTTSASGRSDRGNQNPATFPTLLSEVLCWHLQEVQAARTHVGFVQLAAGARVGQHSRAPRVALDTTGNGVPRLSAFAQESCCWGLWAALPGRFEWCVHTLWPCCIAATQKHTSTAVVCICNCMRPAGCIVLLRHLRPLSPHTVLFCVVPAAPRAPPLRRLATQPMPAHLAQRPTPGLKHRPRPLNASASVGLGLLQDQDPAGYGELGWGAGDADRCGKGWPTKSTPALSVTHGSHPQLHVCLFLAGTSAGFHQSPFTVYKVASAVWHATEVVLPNGHGVTPGFALVAVPCLQPRRHLQPWQHDGGLQEVSLWPHKPRRFHHDRAVQARAASLPHWAVGASRCGVSG